MQDFTITKKSNAVSYHVLGKSAITQQVSMIYFIAVHRRGIDEELVFTTNRWSEKKSWSKTITN